jgi:hypothetical protein
MKHTLGPWRLRTAITEQGQPLVIYPPDGNLTIARICINKGEEVMEANARLMVQAPRMAQLLKCLVDNGWSAGITMEAREIITEIEK